MEIATVIIGILLGFLIFISLHISNKKMDDFYMGISIGFIMSFFIVELCLATTIIIKNHTPTAMDVYQGKTTLEITYKDGVPIDSVVVFKN